MPCWKRTSRYPACPSLPASIALVVLDAELLRGARTKLADSACPTSRRLRNEPSIRDRPDPRRDERGFSLVGEPSRSQERVRHANVPGCPQVWRRHRTFRRWGAPGPRGIPPRRRLPLAAFGHRCPVFGRIRGKLRPSPRHVRRVRCENGRSARRNPRPDSTFGVAPHTREVAGSNPAAPMAAKAGSGGFPATRATPAYIRTRFKGRPGSTVCLAEFQQIGTPCEGAS